MGFTADRCSTKTIRLLSGTCRCYSLDIKTLRALIKTLRRTTTPLIGLKTINSQKCSFYQNSSFSVFESFRPLWLKREASFCFKREKSALFLQIVYYYTQFLSKVHLEYLCPRTFFRSKASVTLLGPKNHKRSLGNN